MRTSSLNKKREKDIYKEVAFLKCIYLFIFGCAASLLLCGLFSSCGEPGATLELQCTQASNLQWLLLWLLGSKSQAQ